MTHPAMTPSYARRRMEQALLSLAKDATAQVQDELDFVDVCFELRDTFENSWGIMLECGDMADRASLEDLDIHSLREHLNVLSRSPWAWEESALSTDPGWAHARRLATALLNEWKQNRVELD